MAAVESPEVNVADSTAVKEDNNPELQENRYASQDKDVDSGSDEPRHARAATSAAARRYSVLVEELSSHERSEKTISEMCTNCSFQAYNVFGKGNYRADPKINTLHLSKARTLGVKSVILTVGNDLFTETPVGSIIREFVVYGGWFFMFALWVTVLVELILDLQTANRGSDDYFLAGEVAISSLGMVLCAVDLVQHLCTYRCKACTDKTRGPEWRSETPDTFELTNEHIGDEKIKSCCWKLTHSKYDRAGITRFFVTPLITYPLLLLGMFKLSSEMIIFQVNTTTILSFVLTVIMQIWFVYLIRLFIFLGAVHSIQKIRTGGANGRALLKGSCFQLYFIVSAVGQMVVELLIIAAIGISIYNNYLVFHNTAVKPYTFIPSPELWYMMVFGYFATPVGLAMFFITHYYSTQRFFIKFYLDLLNILRKKAENTIVEKICLEVNSALPEDFRKMEETKCSHKCIYSFISPTISLLSIIYLGFAVGFAFCSFVTFGRLNPNIIISFYMGAGAFAALVNFHIVAIGLLWALVILVVFASIALAIVLAILSIPIILVCLCCYNFIKNPPPPPQPKPDAPPEIRFMPYSTWTYNQKATYKNPYDY